MSRFLPLNQILFLQKLSKSTEVKKSGKRKKVSYICGRLITSVSGSAMAEVDTVYLKSSFSLKILSQNFQTFLK